MAFVVSDTQEAEIDDPIDDPPIVPPMDPLTDPPEVDIAEYAVVVLVWAMD